MTYLRFKDYDLKREAEKLLISRFLPFALASEIAGEQGTDLSMSTHIAYDCISHLSGVIQIIREVYQLQPAHSLTFPSPDALSIAYQLSEAIQMMRQISIVPPLHSAPQSSPVVVAPNGQALSSHATPESSHAAPESSKEQEEIPLEVALKQQKTQDHFNFLFGA
jgi:hypothetical protein